MPQKNYVYCVPVEGSGLVSIYGNSKIQFLNIFVKYNISHTLIFMGNKFS